MNQLYREIRDKMNKDNVKNIRRNFTPARTMTYQDAQEVLDEFAHQHTFAKWDRQFMKVEKMIQKEINKGRDKKQLRSRELDDLLQLFEK